MGALRDIATIARWEVKKSFSLMGRNVLPLAIVLFVLLIAVTGFATQSGMHLQDGMYEVGVDDPQIAGLIASDARFSVYQIIGTRPDWRAGTHLTVVIIREGLSGGGTEKSQGCPQDGRARLREVREQCLQRGGGPLCRVPALDRCPDRRKANLTFLATQSGQSIIAAPAPAGPGARRAGA